MARRAWESLALAYRSRLERSGITSESYASGVSLKGARGHASTPERPARAFRNPDLYSSYLRRRVSAGKPVPANIIDTGESERRIIGDAIGWPGRDGVYKTVFFRSAGGSAAGEEGVRTVFKADPKTGNWNVVRTGTYDQADFVELAREARQNGFVVQVVSVPSMGVTA